MFKFSAITNCLVLSVFACLAGCRATERLVTPPTATVESAVDLDLDGSIPAADAATVAMREMDLKINSELLDDAAKRQLAQGLARDAGDLTSWKTKDKRPEYRVVVKQVQTAEEWNASPIGAGTGALAGAALGGAVADNAYEGAAVGGVVGAAAGWALFGEQKDTWMFSVAVYRKTTPGAVKQRLDALKSDGLDFQSTVAGSSMSVGSSKKSGKKTAEFDFDSDEYPQYFSFIVRVESGSLHSRSAVEKAAREKLVAELPGLIFGGTTVSF